MMLVPCPWCGPRNATEFRYGGAAGVRPDPVSATPQQWREYLYAQRNTLGWSREGWYHRAGCRRYITVERHTGTNEVRPTVDTATEDG
jgi:heterotetrameric sarcosine oxidase delta subunit